MSACPEGCGLPHGVAASERQCWDPGTGSCLVRQVALLRQKLVASERENAAWRALASHRVGGYCSEFTASGEEGTDSFEYHFSAEHRQSGKWIEAASVSKQAAAIGLAEQLGLIDKAGG